MSSSKKDIWFMRQAGRYLAEYRQTRKDAGGFLNLCFNPEKATEVTLQPIRRFGFSHSIIFSDILTIPHALGFDVKIDENKGGPLVETLYKNDDILNLKDYDISKIQKVLEAINLTREKLPKETKLIGFCGAPWTLAVYIMQGRSSISNQETHIFSYKNRDLFTYLISHLTKQIINYLEKQIEAGCDTIQLFDSWAAFLSPENFEEFIVTPHKEIFYTIAKKYPHVTKIGFPRGAGGLYEQYAKITNCDVMGCDQSVSIENMKKYQKICGIQGNLDPYLLLSGGDLLIDKTRKLTELYETGKYIFNLGHGILPQTPIENVSKVLSTVRES